MRTLSTEQLLAWIRWYRRHRRNAPHMLNEDVPGTRIDPPDAPDAPDTKEPGIRAVRAPRRR